MTCLAFETLREGTSFAVILDLAVSISSKGVRLHSRDFSFSLDDKGRDERIRRVRSDPLAFPRRQGYFVQTLVV